MKFHVIRNYSNFKYYALFVYNFIISSKLIYIDWKKYYPKGSMRQKKKNMKQIELTLPRYHRLVC